MAAAANHPPDALMDQTRLVLIITHHFQRDMAPMLGLLDQEMGPAFSLRRTPLGLPLMRFPICLMGQHSLDLCILTSVLASLVDIVTVKRKLTVDYSLSIVR